MTHKLIAITLALLSLAGCSSGPVGADRLAEGFANPPLDSRPGVYWYFMDGNLSREGITKDLETMKKAGIGYVIFLEVQVGVPRGNVDFMSEEWMQTFEWAVSECRRLDIQMTLGIGPGWNGSGGPWVTGPESMRHLVSSKVYVTGPDTVDIVVPRPDPRPPFFGTRTFTPEVTEEWNRYYEDVALLAFPCPDDSTRIDNIAEKALYIRAPYSSTPNVRECLPPAGPLAEGEVNHAGIDRDRIVDLTALMDSTGRVHWVVPEGRWTLMRLGARNTGSVSRPAPVPGVGMECDKMNRTHLASHFSHFLDPLLDRVGDQSSTFGGLKMIHIDSWEMGAQNWTDSLLVEFRRRRGYDPVPWLPVYSGRIVGDSILSERFLWDLRRTVQELIVENHITAVREKAHDNGLQLSIEPYDMTPASDLELGVAADMPMCEFWAKGFGFDTQYAVYEGVSAAHVIGQPVVPAESFTSHLDGWKQYPGMMKDQTNWALAAGVNRIMFHTFQHQALDDSIKPGMTMGPYGCHWDRGQTWWPMSDAYHTYISRSQYMLQQGRTVADIMYLVPESQPHTFRAPNSALIDADKFLSDRRGYNFDGCPPSVFMTATVGRDGSVMLPGGASYRIVVLPDYASMSADMLRKIKSLVDAGATVVGRPPQFAPGLSGYPESDAEVRRLAAELWSSPRVILYDGDTDRMYQPYGLTAAILSDKLGVNPDFEAVEAGTPSENFRYTHRTADDCEIYYIANRTDTVRTATFSLRDYGRRATLADPMDGSMVPVAHDNGVLTLTFEPHQSYFVVFDDVKADTPAQPQRVPSRQSVASLDTDWSISFPMLNGDTVTVAAPVLFDWKDSDNANLRYYSGTATYTRDFDLTPETGARYELSLGDVDVMARVTLNGNDLGVLWSQPWRVDVTDALAPDGHNTLTIDVVNLWQNRLIGDEQLPYDGIVGDKWPDWFVNGTPRTSGRQTFTTWRHVKADDPLHPSGLHGPVTIDRLD